MKKIKKTIIVICSGFCFMLANAATYTAIIKQGGYEKSSESGGDDTNPPLELGGISLESIKPYLVNEDYSYQLPMYSGYKIKVDNTHEPVFSYSSTNPLTPYSDWLVNGDSGAYEVKMEVLSTYDDSSNGGDVADFNLYGSPLGVWLPMTEDREWRLINEGSNVDGPYGEWYNNVELTIREKETGNVVETKQFIIGIVYT